MKALDTIRTANRRARELKKRGIDNNALQAFELRKEQLKDRFGSYGQLKGKDKAKYRRAYVKAFNDFLKNPQSTVTGIKKEYKKKGGKGATSIQEMSDFIDKSELMSDDILREQLGSQVMQDTYHDARINEYTTDEVRESMSDVLLKHRRAKNMAGLTTSDLVDEVLDLIQEKRKNENNNDG